MKKKRFMTRKNRTFFVWFMTQRILHFFWTRLKDLNLSFGGTWLKEFLPPKFDTKNWIDFINMAHRIEPFQYDSKNSMFEKKGWRKELNLFSWIWRKELNLSYMTQRTESSQYDSPKNWTSWKKRLTQRIELFFLKKWFTDLNPSFQHDSKNWALLLEHFDSKNCTLFWQIADSKVLNLWQWFKEFNVWKMWLKDLNFVMTKELNDFFFSMWLKEVDPFLFDVSQRIEPFLSKKKKDASKNWTLFLKKVWLKELTFFFTWLKELHFFMTQRIELFLNMTQSIEFLFDSKNWTLFQKFLKELMFFIFFQKLIFLNMTQKELNQWKKKTQIWTFSFQISL